MLLFWLYFFITEAEVEPQQQQDDDEQRREMEARSAKVREIIGKSVV